MIKPESGKNRLLILITLLIAGLLIVTGCSGSGAEAQISQDLESMRQISEDDETVTGINGMLSNTAKDDFKAVLDKIGDFEYEITESEPSEDGMSASVTVRIKTYSFGWEYLRTWNSYFETQDEEAFDQTEFYDLLMKNLSKLESKSYYKDVVIKCYKMEDSEDWTTDALSNADLRDAVLGGMLTEIKELADI